MYTTYIGKRSDLFSLIRLDLVTDLGDIFQALENQNPHGIPLLHVLHLVTGCVCPVALHLDVDVQVWKVEVWDVVPLSPAPRGVLQLEAWVSYPADTEIIQTLSAGDLPRAIHGDCHTLDSEVVRAFAPKTPPLSSSTSSFLVCHTP